MQRSDIMRAVKSRDTSPEKFVRKLLSSQGYRYRLHARSLPGAPDIVFPGRRKAIFVHGCFWHGHHCARGSRVPKTNVAYWKQKISRNVARDGTAIASLKRAGWKVKVIWECELKNPRLPNALKRFLGK